jgi:DNA-binding transcriptional regulator YbjK
MARRPNDPQRRERILQATLDTIARTASTRSRTVKSPPARACRWGR